MQRRAASSDVERFARAVRRTAWRLGRVAEMPEDLAHDDGVGELRDEAAWAALVKGR